MRLVVPSSPHFQSLPFPPRYLVVIPWILPDLFWSLDFPKSYTGGSGTGMSEDTRGIQSQKVPVHGPRETTPCAEVEMVLPVFGLVLAPHWQENIFPFLS